MEVRQRGARRHLKPADVTGAGRCHKAKADLTEPVKDSVERSGRRPWANGPTPPAVEVPGELSPSARAAQLRAILGLNPTHARPLCDILSFDAFVGLLQQKVGEVPELQPLWAWQARTGQAVGFAGGRLRGLIRWLHQALLEHGPERVAKMRAPSLAELEEKPEASFTKGADFDLFTSDATAAAIKAELSPYVHWDLLPEAFLSLSEEAGGMTLEKTSISPLAIFDPRGALADYHQGRLRFDAGPLHRVVDGDKSYQITRLSQVLRFLRLASQMPEAAVDEETLETMLFAVKRDREEGSTQEAVVVTSAALVKLHERLGRDTQKTLGVLESLDSLEHYLAEGCLFSARSLTELMPIIRDPHFLGLFARYRPGIPSYVFKDVALVLDALIEKAVPFHQLVQIGALVEYSDAYLERVVPAARSAKELLDAFESCVGTTKGPYMEQSRARSAAPYLERFFQLNPTAGEKRRLDALTGGAATRFGRLAAARTPAAYLEVLKRPIPAPASWKSLDARSREAMERFYLHDLVIQTHRKFCGLQPTASQHAELLALIQVPHPYVPEAEVAKVVAELQQTGLSPGA